MLDATWFTEVHAAQGSAFSLKLTEKLAEVQSPFQKIEVFATEGFGPFMVIDGCTMVSAYENFLYHEMLAHPVLFTHAAPRQVVIIGGGDCGTLREVLRHPEIEAVVQIDIDEQVTRLSERFFPELCESNQDPRATLLFADGIRWMAEAETASADVIIVDGTDPVGPGEGLFTEAFYRDCHRVLRPGGLLVQQTESPLYHADLIGRTHRFMRRCGFAGTQLVCFPQPIYPSGWWSATLAARDDGSALTQFREAAAAARPFATRYYNPEMHRAALGTPEFLKPILAGATDV